MQLARIQSLVDHCVSLDTETHLRQPGLPVPPLVLGSAAWLEPGPKVVGALLDKQQILESFIQALEDQNTVISGAHITYDLLVVATYLAKLGIDVLPLIFKAFEEDRIYDILIAEKLHAIANGHLGKDPITGSGLKGYTLDAVTDLVLGRTNAKANDEYRLRYAEFDGVPLDQLPQEAHDYPIDDARNTHEDTLAQTGHLPKVATQHNWGPGGVSCIDCGATKFSVPCLTRRPHRNLYDLSSQLYSAFTLELGAVWGFKVDQSYVDIIEQYSMKRKAAGIAPFVQAGIIRTDGTEDRAVLKKLVAQAYGSKEPCTVCAGTGKVKHPVQDTLRCPDCKGRCQPWKSGGTLKEPTVASCTTCNTTGRVFHHNVKMMTCEGPHGEKTCDGTGLLLTEDVPRSDKEGIAFGRDALAECGQEFLMSLAHFKEDEKVLKDYVPYLREARVADPVTGQLSDIPLTLKPNAVLETGRVSYRGYIQTFPRKPGFIDRDTGQYIPSLRECFVARPGTVFSSEDYEAGELITHAQNTLWVTGSSELARALVAGIKVHNALAGTMLGITYEEYQARQKEKICKDMRQAAKPANFGYPGGLGAVTLVHQQRKQGPDTPHPSGPNLVQDENGNLVPGYKGLRFCILMDGADSCGGDEKNTNLWKWEKISPTCRHCLDCATRLKDLWLRQWPENEKYFKIINECVNQGMEITPEALARWPHLKDWFEPDQRLAPGEIMQHVSGRVRGGTEYCSAANSLFQGLLGDAAKSAFRRIQRECYDSTFRVPDLAHENSVKSNYAGGPSPLLGSRAIVFIHDELLMEHPESVASDGAYRVSEVMVDELRHYCPDLAPACKAEPTLMKRWFKGASKVTDSNGRLIPWEPSVQKAA